MKSIITFIISALAISFNLAAEQSTIGASLHKKFDLAVEDIPPSAIIAIKKIKPNITIQEAEKELKHGNTYIDVEALDQQGNEIEFDLMLVNDEWKVVEIQRDLTLQQVPKAVVNVLNKHLNSQNVKRIIESVQNDNVIIFEFYTVSNTGTESKHEIKWHQNVAEYLTEEWRH